MDAKFKHLCNGKQYLDKDPTHNPSHSLLADVFLWLISTYLKKGYYVSKENYFITLSQEGRLKFEKTTAVGIIRKQEKYRCSCYYEVKDDVFIRNIRITFDCISTVYKGKKLIFFTF